MRYVNLKCSQWPLDGILAMLIYHIFRVLKFCEGIGGLTALFFISIFSKRL